MGKCKKTTLQRADIWQFVKPTFHGSGNSAKSGPEKRPLRFQRRALPTMFLPGFTYKAKIRRVSKFGIKSRCKPEFERQNCCHLRFWVSGAVARLSPEIFVIFEDFLHM